ncbi:MAG: hypothetical protein ACFFAU_09945 [Candidatus Hodarchaeota archaeon]
MKISRYIIPLTFILVFASNIYALSPRTTNNAVRDISYASGNGLGLSDKSPTEIPSAKIGSTIIDGETNLTTDKDKYNPGDSLKVTADSKTSDMNGSLEWRLESPIGEIPFDFYSDLQEVFEDPTFDNITHPDWINEVSHPFSSVESTFGYLNLTAEADADEIDNEIYYYNPTALISGEKYVVSFNYYSKGENLLENPGFEGGNTTGWLFNSSYVELKSDSNNASEGNWYASINGTEGYLLKQNVTGVTGDRYYTFSAKATGSTLANYWSLRLEAYNSTNHLIGASSTLEDSVDFSTDTKGYVFNKILRWKIPKNTTVLGAIFFAHDAGGEADGLYTGWADDFILAEAPPALIFSYWGPNKNWTNKTLDGGNHEWETTTREMFTIDIGANLTTGAGVKTFRFFLKDESIETNITTAYWLIDNITLNLVTQHTAATEISENRNSGTINSTWIHRGFQEELVSTYNIIAEKQVDVEIPPDVHAIITIDLPSHQIYFGAWVFMLTIHREVSLPSEQEIKRINISFVVEERMNYILQDVYMLRGSTNITQGNESIYTDYFERETNIEAISPGDNVTILGYLEANSTPGEWYDLGYLRISFATVEYTWYSNWSSKENITWIHPHFISYQEGGSVLDGNFSAPHNNLKSVGLNFKIPNRGIFGNLTANLSITLENINPKPGNVGGSPHTIEIPLNLPPVRFKINITDENLPESSYFLTDYIAGNITVDFLNFLHNLTEIYPGRNITSNLPIPIKDLDLSVIIENNSENRGIQVLHHNTIGKTILWLDQIDPHLLAGSYTFWIRWNTPYKQNITDYERIETTEYTINIQGTLEVQPIADIPQIVQGDSRTINFTVILNETNKKVGGLNLKGIIVGDESNGTLVVYEEEGVYKIDLEIPLDTEAKPYSVQIFVIGRDTPLTEFSYEVIEKKIARTDISAIDEIVKLGGFAVFVIIGISILGLLYWANKSMK